MNVKQLKIQVVLILLLSLYFAMGTAFALNSAKTVLWPIVKSDTVTFPSAADTVIKVTDNSGQVATYSGADIGEIAYAEGVGVVNINMGNFTAQWADGDTIKIEVTSGTAGTQSFEFGDATATLDAGPFQAIPLFTLTASQRNMTKTDGDAQSQVYSTVLAKDLEVTVVDDLGDAVVGQTPTAVGDGTITAFSATDANGKATATWTLGPAVGAQTMTVSLAGFPNAVFTATATTGPLASYDVAFTAFDSTAGASNNITVTAKDVGGNIITNHDGTVTITATDSSATLPAASAFTAGENGVKTVAVTLETAGAHTITATTGSVTGTVNGTVVAAAASKIDLSASKDTVASDGKGTSTLTATLLDPYDNIVTAAAGNIDYTVSGAGVAYAAWTTMTKAIAAGKAAADFTTKAGTVPAPTTVSVVAGDGTLTSAPVTLNIVNFSISPAATDAGIGDTVNLTVVGAQGPVTWSITAGGDVGSLGTPTGTNDTDVVFTVAKSGTATIKASEGGIDATATITATGPLDSYTVVFDAFDPAAGAVNGITITAKDADGSTMLTHDGEVTITATDPNAVLPVPVAFGPGDAGVKKLNVTLTTAGAHKITATTGSVTGTVDGTVIAAAATKIDLTASKNTVASDGKGTSTLTATIVDTYDNVVTAAAGNIDYTVSGAGVAYAAWTTMTKAIAAGKAAADFTTKAGTVPAPTTVSVIAGDGTLTSAPVTLNIVNFSVSPAASNARIGDTITLTVEGAQGTVTWAVGGDAGVGSLGTPSGTNDSVAVFTVAAAGDATITVTEGTKTSTATIAAHDDVAITDLPTDTVTVDPGDASAEFAVTGGDGTYTWTYINPAGASVVDGALSTYTFTAPSTGNFAGDYTITVTDSISTNAESFKIYVPLVIEPDDTKISIMSDAAPFAFTITGAANAVPYTVTVDSLDDAETYTPVTALFNASNTAIYAFDPSDYTVTADTGDKDYSLEFEVQDLTDPPMVDITIVPVTQTTFAGIVTDTDGFALNNAIVTITSPAGFKGLTDTTGADGVFSFSQAVIENTKIVFKAEKDTYVTEDFTSDDLASDGSSQIQLSKSATSISGNVTNGVVSSVSLFDESGLAKGPIDSAANGDFKFDFATAPAPGDYTITASTATLYGATAITADSFPYTTVSVTMGTALAADEIPVSGGTKTVTVGTKTLELKILPSSGAGKVTGIAASDASALTVVTDSASPITSGIKWDLIGMTDEGCAVIEVPCSLDDAIAIDKGGKAVWYYNDGLAKWTEVPRADIQEINYNGVNSSVKAKICDWSANIVGIGNASAVLGTGGDSDNCFIGSLTSTGTGHHMMAWISMMAILAAGMLIAVNRKQHTN
ncbi:hypothetical protein [Desulfobacula sp.]|uniref:beta strand repeat-containing protein n=1 Tax=Desulfobacula sp. TaxID=2593537 RepID=UPI0026195B54|nr:hypothetical protein [Desulfobacula sp.]